MSGIPSDIAGSSLQAGYQAREAARQVFAKGRDLLLELKRDGQFSRREAIYLELFEAELEPGS